LSGHPIWREHWDGFHHESALQRSADGSRFAMSTVVPSALSSTSPADEDNSYLLANGRFAEPNVEQSIQVFETATGHPVQVVTVKTVILGNRNFSLSPGGTRLAVIDGTELRIYNLPAPSREEMATYLAMKADTPGLTPPMPDSISNEEDTEDTDDEPVPVNGTEATNARGDRGGLAPIGDDASANLSRSQNPVQTPMAAASEAAGQPADSEASSVSAFRSRANEVVLDVVVTDSKGRTVPGLSRSSFRVEEEGKPQQLTYFHEFSAKASAPPPDALTVLRPNIFTNQAASPSEPKVVLVLDFLNTPFTDQQSLKQELLKFLKNKPATTPLALCVMTDRLQMLQGFTTDENLLVAHLDSKKGRIRFGSELQSLDMKELIDKQRELAAEDAQEQVVVQRLLQLQTENRAFQMDQRMSATVNAFAQLARYLAGIPGRKSIVWLSGSLPAGFFGNTSMNWDTPDASPVVRSYGEQLREATNLLAQTHIAVYPVDVRGFTVDSVYESSNNADPIGAGAPGSQTPGPPGRTTPPSSPKGLNTAMNNPAPNPLQLELEQQHSAREAERASMDQVAEETGGKAFYGNRIQQAVNAAVEQASAYYLLSYPPANRNYDGKFRKVKVSLEGSKYHLAYRHGYYAVDPEAPSKSSPTIATAMRQEAMRHDAPQSRQLLFALRISPEGKPVKSALPSSSEGLANGASPSPGREVQRYAVDYAVSPDQIYFSRSGDVRHAVLDFLISAYTDNGAVTFQLALQSTLDLKPAVYKEAILSGLRLHREVEIPLVSTSLRMGVEDETGQRVGTMELPLPLEVPVDQATREGHKIPLEPN